MAAGTTIDLGTQGGMNYPMERTAPKKYYPTVRIEAGALDIEAGDEVIIKGTAKEVTERIEGKKTIYSCVIECTELTCDCEGDLSSALDKIARKKIADEGD